MIKKPMMGMAALILTMPAFAAEQASQQIAASEANEENIVADKVKVTGILPDRLEAVPGSFNVVDEKELKARQPFSVREALNQTPGINIVGEDAFALAPNIGVRGLNPRRTSRTLLMEDGVPLFLAPYGDPSAHYSTPLDRVSRIEIVKGSGQTLYGPQTVGGMINFVTKPVPKEFQASVMAIIGNNNFSGGHVNIGTGGDWGGIMLDAVNRKGDGIRDNHDFEINELTLKGQLNLDDRNTLIAKVGWYEENSSISETGLGAVEYAEDKYQAPTGKQDYFNHERKSLQLQHLFQINDQAKLSTQFYYAKSERASFRQINEPGELNGRSQMDRCSGVVATEANSAQCGGRWRPRDYEYWGIEPRLDFSHNLFGIASDAVIGFRYHKEDIQRDQWRDSNPLAQSLGWARANGSHREDIAINVEAKSYYAQNTFYVGDWSLTPGIRVEDIRIATNIKRAEGVAHNNPESDLTNSHTKVLPGFGVAWNGMENTTVFAGVHKGFAPPRPDRDVTVVEDVSGDPVPNSAVAHKVKPEESTNWELGIRSNNLRGIAYEATLFHTQFDEIVISNGFGSFRNGGESHHTGIELGGRIDFGTLYNTAHNFYISGAYTNLFTAKFKKTSLDDDIRSGDRLAYAPKHIASLNFGYEHPVGFNARIGVDYVSEQYEDVPFREGRSEYDALNGKSGKIPSYTLLNASVSYRPVGSKATFFISGHNLGDKEYLATRVDGMHAGRQRQVFGGVRYDF
ncbi:TonB-dependent receptor domain-containing protein [Methylobacillus flagellatus]|uniref:TonB-dependent receptor family protein n=1 Tax=Methylobacillus flagellatus TaxID=405 RepID=UPI00286960D8|nr:TonB-dependent receptor [Methylobacillus flagellatus]